MFKKILSFTFVFAFCAAALFALKIENSRSPLFAYADRIEVYGADGSFCGGIVVTEREYPFVKFRAGESCTAVYIGDKSAEEIFAELGGKILFSETTEAGVSYYGYSEKIRYRKKIGENVVNLHVFKGKDDLKIGTPLIYGSY